MNEKNANNPYAPPEVGKEEAKKPLQNIVAKRWCYAMLVASMVPLLLFVFTAINELCGEMIDLGDYGGMSFAFGLTFNVGMLPSFAAIFITAWWRLGWIYISLLLLLCNTVLFIWIFWALVVASC